jgi:hypothetical protein
MQNFDFFVRTDDGNLVLYAVECPRDNEDISRTDCSDLMSKYLQNYMRDRSPLHRVINKVSNYKRNVQDNIFPIVVWQSNTAVRWKELLKFHFGKFYFYIDLNWSLNIMKGRKVRLSVLFESAFS